MDKQSFAFVQNVQKMKQSLSHEVLTILNKNLYEHITKHEDHPLHKYAVYEHVDGVDYYYVRVNHD